MIFKKYKRSSITEMAIWDPAEFPTLESLQEAGISVFEADIANGSPIPGDFIARNPDNHSDKWLVAEADANANFESANQLFTFDDLVFKNHPAGIGYQARLSFPNGLYISVVLGSMFCSNGINTYEAWCDAVDDNPRGYLTAEQVTDYMKEIQEKD